MATYREQFYNSTDWKKKVLVMELFHLLMLVKYKEKWHMKNTAKYFGVSMALVSENLKIAHALGNDKLEDCTSRDKALKELKK